MADNKSTYSSLMNELVDTINEKANASDSKNLEELVATAKTIVKPEGTLEITENKQYDVSGYALANVNVPTGSGGDTTQEDGLVEGTLTEYSNSRVTKIATYKFYKMTNLTSVNLSNVKIIGEYAFTNCSNLKNINISKATTIEKASFRYSGILNIDLPSVTNIGDYAFENCTNLKTITIPNVTSIGAYAFQSSVIETLDLPKIPSLGENSLYNMKKLTNVNIPNATTIGSNAFYSNDLLLSLDLPNVETINSSAIYSCKLLETINMPKAKSIGNYAFRYCYSLKKIVIKQTDKVCTLSNSNAFDSCYTFKGVTNPTYNPNGDKGYIYVPDSLVDSYKSATNWSTYADQIKPLSELEE